MPSSESFPSDNIVELSLTPDLSALSVLARAVEDFGAARMPCPRISKAA